jgi:uncharacterized membrane protein
MKQSEWALWLCVGFIALSVFSAISASVSGMELEYYGVESAISDDMSARTVLTIKFSEPVNNSSFTLNHRISNLTASTNADAVQCRLAEESRIACDFTGMTKAKNILTLAFSTKESFDQSHNEFNFSSDYGISIPAKEAFVMIKIPKNSVLSKEPANQSYFPNDGKILTDGKYIMVYWQRQNVTSQDSLAFSVSYLIPSLQLAYSNMLIIAVAGIVIMSMIGVAVYLRRGYGSGASMEVLTSVLNTDEKRVVDILTKHGGKSGQKVIVRESDFSKAKVSRLVKNLKSRGVVEIEPISGRENRIILKFDKRDSEQKATKSPSGKEQPEKRAEPAAEKTEQKPIPLQKDPVIETESYAEDEEI